jgi:hypothetical protein
VEGDSKTQGRYPKSATWIWYHGLPGEAYFARRFRTNRHFLMAPKGFGLALGYSAEGRGFRLDYRAEHEVGFALAHCHSAEWLGFGSHHRADLEVGFALALGESAEGQLFGWHHPAEQEVGFAQARVH